MNHYRVTRPERYSQNTPGHDKPAARQGYYTDARDPMDAADKIRRRLIAAKEYGSGLAEMLFDVQPWGPNDKGPTSPVTRITFGKDNFVSSLVCV